MLNKCIVEFQIKGQKRGLKFGTQTVRLIMEMRGIKTLMDLIRDMSDPGNIPFVLDMLYCSAVSYAASNKIKVDFTKEDVADWMDEIGLDEATAIINKAFTQYSPPDSKKKSLWQTVREAIGISTTGKRLQYQSLN